MSDNPKFSQERAARDRLRAELEAIAAGKSNAAPDQSAAAAPDTAAPGAAAPKSPSPPYIKVPGRLPEDDPWTIRRKPAAPADTEILLNNLIEECGFLMREVAFRLICKAGTTLTAWAIWIAPWR